MNWFFNTLKLYPELSIFFTLVLGHFLSSLKIKNFKINTITSILVIGILVGQLNIEIDNVVKSIFYLLFLFSLGYTAGPNFFNSLRQNGFSQLTFTFILCFFSIATTIIVSKLLGFNVAEASGLAAGALTQSSIIVSSQDALSRLASSNTDNNLITLIPICFSITYIFGTIGSAFIISTLAPKILKVDLCIESKEYENFNSLKISQDQLIVLNDSDGIIQTQNKKDIFYLGIGTLLGGLIGIPVIFIHNFAINLSMSGGALIMGLILGHINSKYPYIVYIPEETLVFISNIGLYIFIAILGINTGPYFISGIKSLGIIFVVAGILVTTLPILFGILIGKYIFKWKIPIILGACAGAITSTAAISLLCEKSCSKAPMDGYTITYSAATILLTILGSMIVNFFP